jgi:hypothetical protein
MTITPRDIEDESVEALPEAEHVFASPAAFHPAEPTATSAPTPPSSSSEPDRPPPQKQPGSGDSVRGQASVRKAPGGRDASRQKDPGSETETVPAKPKPPRTLPAPPPPQKRPGSGDSVRGQASVRKAPGGRDANRQKDGGLEREAVPAGPKPPPAPPPPPPQKQPGTGDSVRGQRSVRKAPGGRDASRQKDGG